MLMSIFNLVMAVELKVVGNNVISENAIQEAAHFPSNNNVADWNEAVKRLYQTGWFDKISIDVKEDHVILTLQEYPVLLAYKVESKLDQLKPEKIIEMLEDVGIKKGFPLPIHKLEQWKLGALQELKRMGYESANVSLVEEKQQNAVVLNVIIDGGPLTLVRRIVVSGNTVFSSGEILSILDVKPQSLWRWMDSANRISIEKNKLIENQLKSFYEAHGYFNAKVVATWVEVNKKKNKEYVDLHLNIDAGKQALINKVYAVGDCGALTDHMALLKSSVYNGEKLHLHMKNSNLLRQNMQVRIQPRLLPDGVDVVLVCNILPPLVVRDIEIIGDGTDDLLLRNLLDFDEGDTWNGDWLLSSKRRLLGQPYIEDANIIIKPDPNKPGEADVVVTIDESKKNTMASLRLSYEQGGNGLGFGGGFSNRNFLGTGNSLSFESQYSSVLWYTDLQLTQPLLPRYPSALLGFSLRVTNQDKLNLGQYKQDLASAYYGYRWLINDQLLLQSQISLRANHFVLYNENVEYLQDELNIYGYDPIEFAWANTFVHDTRDRAERTTLGHVAKVTLSTVIPVFQDMMAYYQITPSLTFYNKLMDLFQQPVVLRSHASVGYGQSYGEFSGSLPFYNRYYAGGIGTVRGYNLFSLGPSYTDESGYERATGGNWLIVGNLDLLLPSLYPDFLQPSLFLDAGNVYLNGVDFSKLRYSTGLSTAINTPIAQITVTIATFFNQGDEKYSTFTVEMGRQF